MNTNPNEKSTPETCGKSLELHLAWFQAVLDARMQQHFDPQNSDPFSPPTPPAVEDPGPVDRAIEEHGMGWEEKILLLLAIAQYVKPEILDIFFTDNPNLNRGFTEFGGIKSRDHGHFLPTGETAMFIIAGDDLTQRLHAMHLLQPEHFFFRTQILERAEGTGSGPALNAPLTLSMTSLHRFLWDEPYRPDFQPGFPATRVSTHLEWDDLVLAPSVMGQISEIRSWMQHESLIQEDWGFKKILKPGYRCLFFGPPGTGKTLTAALLGGALQRDVYRIDLSTIVSKYIGETEKNLAGVFDQAENKEWILFFDEADALFGKRTQTQSSNDRYANQEVSYLLQRVEDFPGLVILASNFKGNMDDAFTRRFQSMIHFPTPGPNLRRQLWQQAFALGLSLAPDVDLEAIADQFEVTGGEIVNVVRSIAVQLAERGSCEVHPDDILAAVRREFQKDGRMLGH